MDEVVDQLFVFQGDGVVKGFMGNYSQYKDYLDAKLKEERKEQNVQKREVFYGLLDSSWHDR